jgi:hypothetical protein
MTKRHRLIELVEIPPLPLIELVEIRGSGPRPQGLGPSEDSGESELDRLALAPSAHGGTAVSCAGGGYQ